MEEPPLDEVRGERGGERGPARNLDRGPWQARCRGEHIQDLTELEVLTPEHVAAALKPPLGGEQVAGGDVVDVDDVQRRVEPPRDAPVQEVEHRPARRRGRPVARTDRQRRLHQDRRQSLRRCT